MKEEDKQMKIYSKAEDAQFVSNYCFNANFINHLKIYDKLGQRFIPGDGLWGYVRCYVLEVKKENKTEIRVVINDFDDAYIAKLFNSIKEAQDELNALEKLSPICMEGLKKFGYTFY